MESRKDWEKQKGPSGMVPIWCVAGRERKMMNASHASEATQYRCMMSADRDVPELRTATTVELSERNCTLKQDHDGLQMCAATTTGTHSKKAMDPGRGRKDQD